MIHRKEIISHWARFIKATKYLELGLHDVDEVFNHIPCSIKHSVDINDQFANYTMSTDSFFYNLKNKKLNLDEDYKWDIIFIDANHLANFVKNDLINSLNHLSDGGMIFLHDVLPPNYGSQLENGDCQTAWKVIPYILKHHPELHVCTTDERDGGFGIVFKNTLKDRKVLSENYNIFYEFYIMDVDRKTSQNYIPNSKVGDWVSNPYYNFKEENINNKKNMYKDYYII
tara:strand:- start:119 stop:802 length:684 start_codon:yes stop_codon:yes gene_type:complete